MEYLDVDLEIGPGSGREYPLVVRSAAGEARLTMRFPFDDLALQSRLKDLQIALLRSANLHRKAVSDEEQAVQDFGRSLFEALLGGDARAIYDVSRNRAAQEGRPGVRLRLRILGMIASPSDLDELDVGREQERMRAALTTLEEAGQVELTWLAGQTWEDLQEAMWGGPWHVFHFIGHGGFDARPSSKSARPWRIMKHGSRQPRDFCIALTGTYSPLDISHQAWYDTRTTKNRCARDSRRAPLRVT